MRKLFLLVFAFCSVVSISNAQEKQKSTTNISVISFLSLNATLVFGKSPNCDAGSGVCNLVLEDNPNAIKTNITNNIPQSTITLVFSLEEFITKFPLQVGYFFETVGNQHVPIQPLTFEEDFRFVGTIIKKLGLRYQYPGFNTIDPVLIYLNGDQVTMKCMYREML